jgi:8-hydroxy-5-deazaflavin:NADPH oxidoreductase
MKIGIIGTGNMGTGLGKYWVQNGHQLMLSFSRDGAKLRAAAETLGHGTLTGTPSEAAHFGDVVLLATPYTVSAEALRAAGPLDGKLLFSCVNALRPDLSGMAVGTTSSGAEELAKLAPSTRFVEALPPFAETLHSGSTKFGSDVSSTFICGDDVKAKEIVAGLLRETGVEPVDAGPLRNSRYLEPAMMLLIQLAYPLQVGPVGLKLLRRT